MPRFALRPIILAAMLTAGLWTAPAAAAVLPNLLTNGSFATGDLSGWILGPQNGPGGSFAALTNINGVAADSPDGFFAGTNCKTALACVLRQAVSTTPGQLYDLTFSFNPGPGVTKRGGYLKILWGGAVVERLRLGALGWTDYEITGLRATKKKTTLLIVAAQNFGYDGIDNIALTAVPLPASLPMYGAALTGLVAWARHARRRLRAP